LTKYNYLFGLYIDSNQQQKLIMDSYRPFTIYGNISKYMRSKGYSCNSQNDLLEAVDNDDKDYFNDHLYGGRDCIIDSFRADTSNRKNVILPNLTSYERLTAKWRKPGKDIDSQVLVYFHTPVIDAGGNIKKVAKNDTVTALKYLIHSGCKCLLFVHGPDMIAAAMKQLMDPLIAPSKKNYRFEIKSASLFDINVDQHIYVPKHEIVLNPDKFIKDEGYEKSKMPKISIEDPAIRHLGTKVGDIIRIYRTKDFNDVSTLFYREVVTTPLEVHKPRKR